MKKGGKGQVAEGKSPEAEMKELLSRLFTAHPWHGISVGDRAPDVCNVFVEIVPTESVKYELDKETGHLKVDRPQQYSSNTPTLYGFIPRTYCGEEIGRRCSERTGLQDIKGDGDPIDVCILTEKTFAHGNLVLRARPIGGLRMIDGNEADDKIVAVLEGDVGYGEVTELAQLPEGMVARLRHYFLSYKQLPGEAPRKVDIAEVYDRAEAQRVVQASVKDYLDEFGDPEARLPRLLELVSGRKPAAPPARASAKKGTRPAAKQPKVGRRTVRRR